MTVQLVECPDTENAAFFAAWLTPVNKNSNNFSLSSPPQLRQTPPTSHQSHPPLFYPAAPLHPPTHFDGILHARDTNIERRDFTSQSGRGWREWEASCTDVTSAVLAPNRQAAHRSGRSVAADEAVSIDALVLFLTGRTSFTTSYWIGLLTNFSAESFIVVFSYSSIIDFFPASNHFSSDTLLPQRLLPFWPLGVLVINIGAVEIADKWRTPTHKIGY